MSQILQRCRRIFDHQHRAAWIRLGFTRDRRYRATVEGLLDESMAIEVFAFDRNKEITWFDVPRIDAVPDHTHRGSLRGR